ncbi:MAG: hypothetical protein AABW48_01125 [Nanoarchaeota archaeon]
MEYCATFGIDGGVSPGFGVKYPMYEKREEVLTADTHFKAVVAAATQARQFSLDYLSNPHNDLTTVTLLELCDHTRNPIDVKKVLKDVGYKSIQRFEWDDENRLVTRCSQLEHLLLIGMPR